VSDERLKTILGFSFGFSILAVYFSLSLAFGLGEIKADTSYGLQDVLKGLEPLGVLFCGWAFGMASREPK
jgi:hypothetical protein